MNATIVQLDLNTINQIAAGEVIEDPNSVVKELIENSIDAGSTHITIKIIDGGKKLIEIVDDGKGMSVEDMKICHLKHTTSKIKNIHEVPFIGTLGFRGEALSSISSVSKMKIQSQRIEDEYAYEINLENSNIVKEDICPFSSKHGTRIIVEDLFYNIPARKSFLDNEKTSKITKNIVDLIHRLSMSNTNIRFDLFVDNFQIFTTLGGGSLRNIIAEIYDTKTAKNLIEVNTEVYGVKVSGFISRPEDCIGNRSKQTFFVNGRYVKMDILSQALRKSYTEFAVTSKYPVCVLFLELNNEEVDINVHPKKTEVRFKHNIFPVIVSSVQESLHNNMSSPKVTLSPITKKSPYDLLRQLSQGESQSIQPTIHSFDLSNNDILNFNNELENLEEIDLNYQIDSNIEPETEQMELIELDQSYHTRFEQYKGMNIIGQLHNSYIIAEYSTGMIMIDQHAAHERVLYEKFKREFDKNTIISVDSLIPDTIELSVSDYITVKNNLDFFENYGFILEDFGNKMLIVRQHPSIFKGHQIKNIVISIIEEFINITNKSVIDEVIVKKIIMKSCKSAIKANMKLNLMQMESLLEQLSKCENPYHCPHGRPIIINFTKYEIEKSFNRIV